MNQFPDQAHLFREGWVRVEKDDRLLDIFPRQTREKGIELWEKQLEGQFLFLRYELDRPTLPPQEFILPSALVKKSLLDNKPLNLLDYPATC